MKRTQYETTTAAHTLLQVVILTSNDPAGPASLPRALADRLDGWACMRYPGSQGSVAGLRYVVGQQAFCKRLADKAFAQFSS